MTSRGLSDCNSKRQSGNRNPWASMIEVPARWIPVVRSSSVMTDKHSMWNFETTIQIKATSRKNANSNLQLIEPWSTTTLGVSVSHAESSIFAKPQPEPLPIPKSKPETCHVTLLHSHSSSSYCREGQGLYYTVYTLQVHEPSPHKFLPRPPPPPHKHKSKP